MCIPDAEVLWAYWHSSRLSWCSCCHDSLSSSSHLLSCKHVHHPAECKSLKAETLQRHSIKQHLLKLSALSYGCSINSGSLLTLYCTQTVKLYTTEPIGQKVLINFLQHLWQYAETPYSSTKWSYCYCTKDDYFFLYLVLNNIKIQLVMLESNSKA